MKVLCLLGSIAIAISAVTATATEAVGEAPSAAVDRITLIYMNHKIYPNGSVECNPKVIGNRSMIGCRNLTLNGMSPPHVWLYEAGKFKSVNGSARQLAEGKFSQEPDVTVVKLPLPSDINVGAAVESFTKG